MLINKIKPQAVLLLLAITVACQAQKLRLGEIEFFGTGGINTEKVRASVPLQEGDEISLDALPDLIPRVREAIKGTIGKEQTDLSTVCCDERANLMIFVGLPGKNVEISAYNAQPTGSVSFPQTVMYLYQREMDLNMEAVQKQAVEDRSKGYALSLYPPLRAKQLAMREYATRNASFIRRVLQQSTDAQQRSVAAQLLGYAIQDHKQIASLVLASRDRDEGVRNNAIRALGVLAQFSQKIASSIPAANFVRMLNSGIWTDRNKGAYLLSILTVRRDARLLRLLRLRALVSIVEMARWRNPGHADSARLILGRVAGIDENLLQQLVAAHDLKRIIGALEQPQ